MAKCTLIFRFQMSTIEAKERTTINDAGSTCTIADEQLLKLVVGSLFEDSDAVRVACNNIFAIL